VNRSNVIPLRLARVSLASHAFLVRSARQRLTD
jgi:hypothetical protein